MEGKMTKETTIAAIKQRILDGIKKDQSSSAVDWIEITAAEIYEVQQHLQSTRINDLMDGLRGKFFKECANQETTKRVMPVVDIAPHDVFEWFRKNLTQKENPHSKPGSVVIDVMLKRCNRCGKLCQNEEFYVIVANKNYCPHCYFMAEKGIELSDFEAAERLHNFNTLSKNNTQE